MRTPRYFARLPTALTRRLPVVGLLLFGFAAPSALPDATAAPPLRVLILSGRNNHDWKQTTPRLKAILEAGEQCVVSVTGQPENLEPAEFSKYDVLVSNWNAWGDNSATNWPPATRQAYLDFVRGGKGHVVIHAGSCSFYDWPEYQQLSGGSWNLGQTGHGAVHEFEVQIANPEHPITRGQTTFRTTDELWHRTGFQPGVKVLATAFSSKEQGGSGSAEPVAVVTEFGKGRCFFLVLGHDAAAMQSSGFVALLRRGTAWAGRSE